MGSQRQQRPRRRQRGEKIHLPELQQPQPGINGKHEKNLEKKLEKKTSRRKKKKLREGQNEQNANPINFFSKVYANNFKSVLLGADGGQHMSSPTRHDRAARQRDVSCHNIITAIPSFL